MKPDLSSQLVAVMLALPQVDGGIVALYSVIHAATYAITKASGETPADVLERIAMSHPDPAEWDAIDSDDSITRLLALYEPEIYH